MSPGEEEIQVAEVTTDPAKSGVSDSKAPVVAEGAKDTPVAENKSAGTFLEDDSEPLPGASDWPADWREKMAGDDEKFLNKLKRFGSPLDYTKSYREMEKRASQMKKTLSENATPEEIAQYRKENGIPEKPDGYDLSFDNGLVIGEDDKADIQSYLEDMHGKNAPPEFVKAGVKAYLEIKDKYAAEHAKNEALHKQETIEALRQEWGPEYQANKKMVESFLGKQPDGVGEMLLNARDASGRALLNTPSFAKWVANMAREMDPQSTIAHFTGGTGVSLNERVEQIQKIIRDEPERYYKGAEGQKLQEELSRLVSARDKQNEKVA